MNHSEIKKGDVVRITDGSYSVRLDKYDPYPSIGLSENTFTVVKVKYSSLFNRDRVEVHDIHIQDDATGAMYLHSASCVNLAEPKKCICKCTCPCNTNRNRTCPA